METTPQNINQLLIDARQLTDKRRRNDAVNALIDHLAPHVGFLRRNNAVVRSASEDDFVTAQTDALLTAIDKYDFDRACSFRTYYTVVMTRQLITGYQRRHTKRHGGYKPTISLNQTHAGGRGVGERNLMLADVIPDPRKTDISLKSDAGFLRHHVLDRLSNYEAQIYELRLMGYTMEEVAAKVPHKDGTPNNKKSVDNALQRIRGKLVYLKEKMQKTGKFPPLIRKEDKDDRPSNDE